jgi:hypothetical protein
MHRLHCALCPAAPTLPSSCCPPCTIPSPSREAVIPLSASEAVAPQQRAPHAKGRPAPTPWGPMLRSPAVWAIVVNNFAFHYAFYLVMNWLPTYFNRWGANTSVGVSTHSRQHPSCACCLHMELLLHVCLAQQQQQETTCQNDTLTLLLLLPRLPPCTVCCAWSCRPWAPPRRCPTW